MAVLFFASILRIDPIFAVRYLFFSLFRRRPRHMKASITQRPSCSGVSNGIDYFPVRRAPRDCRIFAQMIGAIFPTSGPSRHFRTAERMKRLTWFCQRNCRPYCLNSVVYCRHCNDISLVQECAVSAFMKRFTDARCLFSFLDKNRKGYSRTRAKSSNNQIIIAILCYMLAAFVTRYWR